MARPNTQMRALGLPWLAQHTNACVEFSLVLANTHIRALSLLRISQHTDARVECALAPRHVSAGARQKGTIAHVRHYLEDSLFN